MVVARLVDFIASGGDVGDEAAVAAHDALALPVREQGTSSNLSDLEAKCDAVGAVLIRAEP